MASNILKPLAPKLAKKSMAASSSTSNSEANVSSTTNSVGGARPGTGNGNNNSGRMKKAFHPTLGYAIPPPLPAKVARRNQRERNRVKQVNCGFEMLRTHIPSAAKHKKMSKVDTLRHAVEYIQSMQNMLDRHVLGEEDTEDNYSITDSIDEHPSPSITSLEPFVKCEEPISPPPMPHSLESSTPHTPTEAYESGYETSSYYSTHSLISPGGHPTPTSYQPHPPSMYGANHHGAAAGDHFVSSSSSSNNPGGNPLDHLHNHHHNPPPVLSSSVIHHQNNQSIRTFNYYGNHSNTNLGIEPNSEEDELLDAIANWQDA